MVAVAQDMGITVGFLPGLSMRHITDLVPDSAKTDVNDAAIIVGGARTMPHTSRAITTSDEDAALSMLTRFDLDLAYRVDQTERRTRGLWLALDPVPMRRRCWGHDRAHDTAGEARRRLADPCRTKASGQDKD